MKIAKMQSLNSDSISLSISKLNLKSLKTGFAQNTLIGFICFCCPGMFNTLNGIGGGGQVDTSIMSDGNTALYSTFTIFGILGGPISNFLGPRLTIFVGTLMYVLYSIALMMYNHIQSRCFVVISGALLGIGAAMLWSAQGALMMAYPTPAEKGKYIGIFWIIFNLGGMIGGAISFVLNYSNDAKGVTNSTYIAFISLMAVGSLLSFFVQNPKDVIRSDGSKVEMDKFTDIKTELLGVIKVFIEWRMLLLIPIFIASNFFYTYQFTAFNSILFSVRTRSLNNSFYWAAQMLASYLFGVLLDSKGLSKRSRAISGLAITTLFMMAAWIGVLFVQFTYSRESPPKSLIDFTEVRFIGPFILYSVFGLSDALVQSWSYWLMGSLSNDTNKLARYSGFYKGIQSAGGAISWRLDSVGVDYMTQLIINWVLYGVSSIFALIVSCFVKEFPKEVEDMVEKIEAEEELNISINNRYF